MRFIHFLIVVTILLSIGTSVQAVAPEESISLVQFSDVNPVGTDHTVTAIVLDKSSDPALPVVGREVTFEVMLGPNSGVIGNNVTDADGVATFTYTGTEVGIDVIKASFVDSGGNVCFSDPVFKGWLSWILEEISVEQIYLTQLNDVNSMGTDHIVMATVLDDYGNPAMPVVGREVTFEVTSGPHAGETGINVTDSTGVATFTYTGTEMGIDVIEASFVDSDGNTQSSIPVAKGWVSWNVSEMREMEVDLAPSFDSGIYLPPLNITHTVAATVHDNNGSPVVGKEVSFYVTSGPNGTAVTDVNGVATFTYPQTGGVPDEIWAYCLDSQGNQIYSNPAVMFWYSPIWYSPPIYLAQLSDANSVGTNHTVAAIVLDKYSDPVVPVVGREVTFEVISGPHVGEYGTVLTDATGVATFTYTGSDVGTDVIEASFVDIGGVTIFSDPVFKDWVHWKLDELKLERIYLAQLIDVNSVGTNHTVIATVLDNFDDPVVDREVTFGVISGPHEGETSINVTDSNGVATFTYTGSEAGIDIIEASFVDLAGNKLSSDPVTKGWVPWDINEPGSEVIYLAPLLEINGLFLVWDYLLTLTHTVTATVVDENNNPVVGREVKFEIISGERAGKNGTDITDSNGVATFTYNLVEGSREEWFDQHGDVGGLDEIRAYCFDSQGNQTYSITVFKMWIDPKLDVVPLLQIHLTPSTETNLVGTDHTVTATVLGDYGNPAVPIAGRDVIFEVTSGPNEGETGINVTDANGVATFTYTGSGMGTDVIRAGFFTEGGGFAEANWVVKEWIQASVDIEKSTNGFDADVTPGPEIMVGDQVTWEYVVNNTGNVNLTNIVVQDNVTGVTPVFQSGDTNNDNIMEPGEVWIYNATGAAEAGQYSNLGIVTAIYNNTEYTDEDPSHYFGFRTGGGGGGLPYEPPEGVPTVNHFILVGALGIAFVLFLRRKQD